MSTPAPLRIGAVDYLNALPLVASLRDRAGVRLVFELPSRLTERFRAGELDVALLPAVAYLGGTGASLVRGLGIASRGPTDSVRLFCARPVRDAKRIGLDPASMTSNALCRVWARQALGLQAEFVPAGPGPVPCDLDAYLRIGDPGMTERGSFAEVIDLGDAWFRWTRLPFVFAAWVVREGLRAPELPGLLHGALADGLARLGETAEAGARRTGLDRTACERYLRERIVYRLGEEEERGLRLFAAKAHGEGLLREERALQFHPDSSPE